MDCETSRSAGTREREEEEGVHDVPDQAEAYDGGASISGPLPLCATTCTSFISCISAVDVAAGKGAVGETVEVGRLDESTDRPCWPFSNSGCIGGAAVEELDSGL